MGSVPSKPSTPEPSLSSSPTTPRVSEETRLLLPSPTITPRPPPPIQKIVFPSSHHSPFIADLITAAQTLTYPLPKSPLDLLLALEALDRALLSYIYLHPAYANTSMPHTTDYIDLTPQPLGTDDARLNAKQVSAKLGLRVVRAAKVRRKAVLKRADMLLAGYEFSGERGVEAEAKLRNIRGLVEGEGGALGNLASYYSTRANNLFG